MAKRNADEIKAANRIIAKNVDVVARMFVALKHAAECFKTAGIAGNRAEIESVIRTVEGA